MVKKVLIVEDEYIVANNLRQVIKRFGYHVVSIAASAEEATELVRMHRPDLALLDIRLQGDLTGIDIAKMLRRENIGFIYLSANSNQQILEEAKKTEPYGFLVKPFRKKDLEVMLDIAWYRHRQSIDVGSQQENLLQQQITLAINSLHDQRQQLLEIARTLQAHIPFDLMAFGPRPLELEQLHDEAFLRIGFDEYQYIGQDELLTITHLKRSALAVILANSQTDERPAIYPGTTDAGKLATPSLQKTLFDTFQLRSGLVFPVYMSDGRSFHYFFYSRQQNAYTDHQIALLNRVKERLTAAATALHTGQHRNASSTIGTKDASPRRVVTHPAFHDIIGNHHLLLAALDLTAQVAPYNTSVLILGETGTGKEKVAQSIHLRSPRKDGPFIKVNCGAIPPTMIESELFGHEKGAFTGAIANRKGRFELAEGGTLFLDEIGELPLDMQVKLLRALQEKEIEPVGGNTTMKVNVRIVAATNRNLEKEVADGHFRLDLYYRLNVFPITVPPLRDRKSDIEALINFFADRYCREFSKQFTGVDPLMMQEMMAYDWPGNIRELENIIEQAAILQQGNDPLTLKRPLAATNAEAPTKVTYQSLGDIKRIQKEAERDYIISVLRQTAGRIRGNDGAAALLNLKPTTLEARISKLDIRKDDYTDQ